MRSVLVWVVLAAAIVIGVWIVLGASPPVNEMQATGRSAVTPVVAVERAVEARREDATQRRRKLDERAAERTAMRERIGEAMRAREAAAAGRRDTTVEAPVPAKAPRVGEAAAVVEDETAPAPAMIDRTGNRAYLTRVMSQDLIPLADECYQMALVQQPKLAGMLVLDVELLGDEDVGGVVDGVEVGKGNEIVDPGLMECVRESLLATSLPPPAEGGRDAFSMSMRFAPDEAK